MAQTPTSHRRALNPRLMAHSVEFAMALERNEFIRRLRQARLDAGLTQEQAAHKMGVALKSWGRWEAPDGATPRVDRIDKIAKTLGVDREYLMGKPEMSRVRPDTDTTRMLAIVNAKLDALLEAGGVRVTGLPEPPASILSVLQDSQRAPESRRRRKT